MIPGRCTVLATFRHISSEFSKAYNSKQNRNSKFLGINKRSDQAQQIITAQQRRMASSSCGGPEHDLAKKQNSLAFEKSPYLLQHASNPVAWFPWGDEALEKARREDKLIFLSVGYSTCHWCHVMERESFENDEIARVMNQFFVNIKVDREERPDIDKIYMTFVQAISGRGGWPMSVFLTPDLTPITGGTYFPPVDKYGQPGFKSILLSIAHKWIEKRSDIVDSGCRILEVLKRSVGPESQSKERSEPSIDCGETCVEQLAGSYDGEFGGFTDSPKFPQPVNLNFLFHMYARDANSEAGKKCLEMCIHTLTKMAKGGIHDHIGQGFARYSVDGKWHVPHFEKMLYDQAQLLNSYSDAYVATKDKFFANVADDIVTYVTRDLHHEEGGFYSAEDADSLASHDSTAKKEGAFYVWTQEELDNLLSKKISIESDVKLSEIFCFHYNVKPEGNVDIFQDPHGELTKQNVLIIYGSLVETAEHFDLPIEDTEIYLSEAREILYEARLKRPRPHLDDKMLTAWNGLMIGGLAKAGFYMNEEKYVKYSIDAAKFVERYLFDKEEGVLLRSCYRGKEGEVTQIGVPIKGFHVDYAFMVKGLLDLYEATFDTHWLEFAAQLQDIQDDFFWDPIGSGYFATTKNDHTAILRLKDDHDGAEPSSNSVACHNLLRLSSYLNRNDLSEKASQLLASFSKPLSRLPAALPELVSGLMHYHDSMIQICIAGKKDSEDTKELLSVVRGRLIPGRVLLLADHEHSDNILFRKSEVIGHMKRLDGRAAAYVCRHHACSLPVTDPKELARLLDIQQ